MTKRSPFYFLDNKFNKFKDKFKDIFRIDFFDTANLFLFVTGSIIIMLLYFDLHFINEFSQFLSDEILFLTFIVILQYTKETFWLKQMQQKTLKQQRIRDDYEIMPFIDIVLLTKMPFLRIVNNGKGQANNIFIEIKYNHDKYQKNISAVIPGNPFELDVSCDEEFFDNFGSFQVDQLKAEIHIHGNYFDIAGRKFTIEVDYKYQNDAFHLLSHKQKPHGWKVGEGLNTN